MGSFINLEGGTDDIAAAGALLATTEAERRSGNDDFGGRFERFSMQAHDDNPPVREVVPDSMDNSHVIIHLGNQIAGGMGLVSGGEQQNPADLKSTRPC